MLPFALTSGHRARTTSSSAGGSSQSAGLAAGGLAMDPSFLVSPGLLLAVRP